METNPDPSLKRLGTLSGEATQAFSFLFPFFVEVNS